MPDSETPENKRDWVGTAVDVGAIAIIGLTVAIIGGIAYYMFKIFFGI